MGDLMDCCELRKVDEAMLPEIELMREEYLAADSEIAGAGPLQRLPDIEEWWEFTKKLEDPATVPENWVVSEQYVYVRTADQKILGTIQFRHYFNDFLEIYGGHIGYSVRPDERRKGYATRMLAACLERCRDFGLERVLITCNRNNEASRRTILANGGVYDKDVYYAPEDIYLERYWIYL